jgi:hypothetical protein
MLNTKSLSIIASAFALTAASAQAACPSNTISQNTFIVKSNPEVTLVNGQLFLKGGNSGLLQRVLQTATNVGRKLTIEGTYRISSDRKVQINRSLNVDATKARFIATTSLDGDMFSFDVKPSSFDCPRDPKFTWLGGRFDAWDGKTSTVIPGKQSSNKGDSGEGVAKTADALSIRGGARVTEGNRQVMKRHLGDVDIRRISVYGTERSSEDYRYAGGDSGILMIAAKSAYIRNNKFYGIRDAAVYLSADNDNGNLGDNYTLIDNYAERVFDGFTSKRGADNIRFEKNRVVDAVVGISTKSTNYDNDKWNAKNVQVKNNTVTRAMRAISLERSDDVVIEDNNIVDLGGIVAGETGNRANLSSFSNDFEGISLNGVRGSYSIKNNSIKGVNASTRGVFALVRRTFDGRGTVGISIPTAEQNKWTGVDRVGGSKIKTGAAVDR